MQQLSKIFKIDQVTTSGYRPQSNGALESSHLVLTEYICQSLKNLKIEIKFYHSPPSHTTQCTRIYKFHSI